MDSNDVKTAGGFTVALAGNPNVGKSTVFNALTGLKQHTGNWSGKTVSCAKGTYSFHNTTYTLVDLPGTYSLAAHSKEEEAARDFICSQKADLIIVVCDATALERNLNLALQILHYRKEVLVCVNLCDEAKKKGIAIDFSRLSKLLDAPVVAVTARKKEGLTELKQQTEKLCLHPRTEGLKHASLDEPLTEEKSAGFVKEGEGIAAVCIQYQNQNYRRRDAFWDRLLTGPVSGILFLCLLLMLIFWITIAGANYLSQWLSGALFTALDWLEGFLFSIHAPEFFIGALVHGALRVLVWVISVMLPPMAIFFPLFTLLEDLGYLPRIAFLLDPYFQKCKACGKQALTICMGFGCNAVGITGCRIIDSPRERLMAILTNSFVPCNGRFPALIAILSMFFVGLNAGPLSGLKSALGLTLMILAGLAVTFAASFFLSKTLLKGTPSSFTLELPPYRKPQIGQILLRSVLDRTLFVLGRAVLVAFPAGLLIWILANVPLGQGNLFSAITLALDGPGRLLGLDGVILTAFLLGFPANEIVLPLILMGYLSSGTLTDIGSLSSFFTILTQNGWTMSTALCTMLFSLFHWPCSTSCLTIYKETCSLKWTAAAILLPTAIGAFLCMIVHFLFLAFA